MTSTVRTHDGLTLRLREWPREGAAATVLLVHGLGEHVGRYAHVAAFLNARGLRVVGHDQRGHGASDGRRGAIDHDDDLLRDLAVVVDAVRGAHRGPLVLLGHSMGGLVAARFVAGLLQTPRAPPWARTVDALVMSSPALDAGLPAVKRVGVRALAAIAPSLVAGNGLKPEWISRDPEVVAAYRADPLVHDRISARLARFIAGGGEQVLALAPRWQLPTLLLWAGADRCVAPRGSAAFVAAASPRVVAGRVFPGLFHEIFNEPERQEVLSALADGLDTLAFPARERTPP